MNAMTKTEERIPLADVAYVETISIGSINPNNPLSEQSAAAQVKKLNTMLNGYPRGTIIGKDMAFGRYRVGEHELVLEKTTYHIGFARRPPE